MKTTRTLFGLAIGLLLSGVVYADTEPNNSIGQAEFVAFGTVLGTVQNSIDIYDYYRTTTPENGTVTVSVTFADGATGRIWFYNANGTSLGVSATGNSVSRVHDCIAAGTVYFSVQYLTGSGPVAYGATISVAGRAYANDAEPNNSLLTATTVLSPNTEYEGQLGHVNSPEVADDAIDYYRAILPEDASAVTVSGISDNGMTFRFYIYNSNGTNLGAGSISATPTNTKGCIAGGDTIYISAERVSGCGGYRFSYTYETSDYEGDVEPNNSLSTTKELLFPDVVYTGHLGYANGSVFPSDGIDYYRAILPMDGSVTVSGESDNEMTFRFYIYNSNGSNLGASTISATPANTIDCVAGGDTIYISAERISGCGGYEFSYSVTPSIYAGDVEPNNSLGTTKEVLSPDVVYTGHLGYQNGSVFPADGIDYYRAVLPYDGNVTVSGVSDNGMTYRFFIYNNAGSNLSTGTSSTTPTNTVDCMAGGDTIYISAQRISGCGGYQFSYSIAQVPQPNDVEPNNSIGTALPITPNFPVEGHLGYVNSPVIALDNDDYYTFSGQGTGPVTFNATLSGSLTARFILRNSAGSTLLTGATSATPTLTFNLTADGVYYLQMNRMSGCGGYTITFDNGCDLTAGANEQVISVGAQLLWANVPGATGYNVRRGLAGGPYSVLTTTAKRSVWFPLVEDTDYEWQVQTVCADRVSGYIPLRPFTTLEFPICPNIGGLTQDSLTSTSIKLTWNDSPYAINYRVEYRVVGSPGGSAVNTPQPQAKLTGLLPGTNYEFRVYANCYGDGQSNYRNGTFSTPAARFDQGLTDWSIWPVPATSSLNVSWSATADSELLLSISDLSGRVVSVVNQPVMAGANQFALSLTGLAAGMYHLEVQDQQGNRQVKPFGIQ